MCIYVSTSNQNKLLDRGGKTVQSLNQCGATMTDLDRVLLPSYLSFFSSLPTITCRNLLVVAYSCQFSQFMDLK